MKRWIRRLAYALATVVVLIAAFAGFVVVKSNNMVNAKYAHTTEPIVAPRDRASVARGEHIVRTIGMCIDCHGADLAGKVMVDDPGLGILVASNLTRGKGGAADRYTDAQMAMVIRHAIKPDSVPAIVMPALAYQHMTDEDVGSVVAYIRSLAPVDRVLPKTGLRFVGRALMATNQIPLLPAANIKIDRPHAATVTRDSTASYGEYLVKIGGCADCHGANLSGGKIPGMPPGTPPAANITPKGIGHYSDADLEKLFRSGKRPDGSQLNNEMPWKFVAGISAEEMTALIKYLRTVAPQDYGHR